MQKSNSMSGVEINERFIPVDRLRLMYELQMIDLVALKLGIRTQLICGMFAAFLGTAFLFDIPSKVLELATSLMTVAICFFTYRHIRVLRQRINTIISTMDISPTDSITRTL